MFTPKMIKDKDFGITQTGDGMFTAWVKDPRKGCTYSYELLLGDMEYLKEWQAWILSDKVGVKEKVSYKLHKTKTVKDIYDSEDKVKYRWYFRVHTNVAGSWCDHVFLYDSTRPTDEDFDWVEDSYPRASEWFKAYGTDL